MQFQSTLPRRERRRKPKQGTNHVNISIHAPAKGATHRIRDLQRKDRFQSTLPRRERHRLHLIKRSDMNFNPRSREGSDVAALAICDANTNFNPRSREGSDKLVFAVTNPSNISIHAPAKGATAVPIGKIIVCIYFNPRSREGSDTRPCAPQHGSRYFNPRSREGSDAALDSLNRKMEISIHAPAKGATMEYTHSASYRQFQSTLPRRERRELAKVLQTSNISIHAPAKGATISYTVS